MIYWYPQINKISIVDKIITKIIYELKKYFIDINNSIYWY